MGGDMNTRNQTKNGTDQYPERDKVTDEDRSSTDETAGKPAVPVTADERQKEERGNLGPERQPGFGQGA